MKIRELDLRAITRSKDNLRKFLAKAPIDEVFRVEDLVGLGYHRDSLNHWHVDFPDNTESLGTNKSRLWGSKKAVAELRRQLQKL